MKRIRRQQRERDPQLWTLHPQVSLAPRPNALAYKKGGDIFLQSILTFLRTLISQIVLLLAVSSLVSSGQKNPEVTGSTPSLALGGEEEEGGGGQSGPLNYSRNERSPPLLLPWRLCFYSQMRKIHPSHPFVTGNACLAYSTAFGEIHTRPPSPSPALPPGFFFC